MSSVSPLLIGALQQPCLQISSRKLGNFVFNFRGRRFGEGVSDSKPTKGRSMREDVARQRIGESSGISRSW